MVRRHERYIQGSMIAMKLLGVFERRMLLMLANCEYWTPVRNSFYIYQAQVDAVEELCALGIAEKLDYDGDYTDVYRITELGRVHVDNEDLPVMG